MANKKSEENSLISYFTVYYRFVPMLIIVSTIIYMGSLNFIYNINSNFEQSISISMDNMGQQIASAFKHSFIFLYNLGQNNPFFSYIYWFIIIICMISLSSYYFLFFKNMLIKIKEQNKENGNKNGN